MLHKHVHVQINFQKAKWAKFRDIPRKIALFPKSATFKKEKYFQCFVLERVKAKDVFKCLPTKRFTQKGGTINMVHTERCGPAAQLLRILRISGIKLDLEHQLLQLIVFLSPTDKCLDSALN